MLLGESKLAKSDPQTAKKEEKRRTRNWVITIFFATIAISASISLVSDLVMGSSPMLVAALVLLMIVFIGIIFDIVGMAVATSSICNDVVGDICGVVSGTASAAISAQILSNFELSFASVVPLALSSLTAALTVGGKAIGKGIAVSACTEIVYHAGQVIYFVTHWKDLFKKKKK